MSDNQRVSTVNFETYFCNILNEYFKGVGIATMVMVLYYNIYYCIIVSWSLYYFIASFVSIPSVPWNTCSKYLLFMNQINVIFGEQVYLLSIMLLERLNYKNNRQLSK